jgi:hypothetical protein
MAGFIVCLAVRVGYTVGYQKNEVIKKGLDIESNPLILLYGSGDRIRTCDLRVMSPTSYQTAPPRIK